MDHSLGERSVQRWPWLARLVRLFEESRHPAVCKDLAVRLTRRAVHDFMRFVRHSRKIVAARRAGETMLTVNREVLAELRFGEPAGALAFSLESVGECVFDGFEQCFARFG